MEYDVGNYLMASSASKSRIERDSGMVHGHAYSVLHVVEIEGLRLVCCRNPWGNDSEWNGTLTCQRIDLFPPLFDIFQKI